jgi:predicted nucleic acid-binding protein
VAAFVSAKTPNAASRLPRTFLDSNIFLYCEDSANPAKQVRALGLVQEHLRLKTGVVSMQVLQEYFANATRKLGVDASLARRKTEVYTRFYVVEPSINDIFAAIDLHLLRKLAFWDAMIVHCAKQAGCREVLSEDMQHGQLIDGVRIVNPFI